MNKLKTSVFDSSAREYDSWFENHPGLFQSECKALEKAVPRSGMGIEIGVGTGRFAKVLNISFGVEPSHAMAQMAIARGIIVINTKAENLPLHRLSFDYAVMITADCFLDNISKAFAEAHRVIKIDGCFVVAMIDKESELGKKYKALKATNSWYRDAHFHSVSEITDLMQEAGFTNFEYWQTLLNTGENTIEQPQPGCGKGSFVVIKGIKI